MSDWNFMSPNAGTARRDAVVVDRFCNLFFRI